MKKNGRNLVTTVIVLSFLIVFSYLVAAAPAKKLSVQGRLTNTTNGNALVGTYSINFSLWNNPSAGSMLFNETQTVTTDSSGLYSVVLTPTDESIFTNQLWMALKVGNDATMTPRVNLTTSPYAYQALDLQCTDCIGPTEINDSYVLLTGDTMSGNLDLGDNLIENIGNSGTDFTSGGGLTLAGAFITISTAALNGGTTIGDAAGDSLTINSQAASIPNNLSIDSNTLFIDATNNRVGIGTDSPNRTLQVAGNITPTMNNTYSLGNSTLVWKDVYVGNNSLHIGGVSLSSVNNKLEWGSSINFDSSTATINSTSGKNLTVTSGVGNVIIKLG